MKIRFCNANDERVWIELNREFMAYEIQEEGFWKGAAEASDQTFAHTFQQALDHPEMITLLLAETDEGEAIGFANLLSVYSVWCHGKALILDDLYIREFARGKGYGSHFLNFIEDYARAAGYKRLQFQSEDWNEKAREFYCKQGYEVADMKFYRNYL